MDPDALVPVYSGLTVDDAQRLADKLVEAGIESFVESTDSPLYAATYGPHARIVLVPYGLAAEARDMVARYISQGHPGVPADQWLHEETGLEFTTSDKPRDDSPNEDILGGTEHFNQPRPGPESPEVEDLIVDDPHDQALADEAKFEGLGIDRPMTEDADSDRPDIQDVPIDQLDLLKDMDDPELGTPSANVRPPKPKPSQGGE